VVMNYGVHAVMYGYYFLMASNMKPKWVKGAFITVAQIGQMIAGVAITMTSFYYYGTEGCFIKRENNLAAFLMYGSYLLLFCQFFFKRYYLPKKSRGKGKKA